jgi:hypothetical protein
MAVRTLDHPPQDHLLRRGRFAVLENKTSSVYRLRQVDLVGGQTVWEREFPQGTVPFAIDIESFGVLSPNGRIVAVSVKDGQSLWESLVPRPPVLQQIYCTMDQDRLFIVLSEPFENASEARINQIRQGYRNPMVNGSLFALRRTTGALLWRTRLRDSAFALDQPKDAPVLVLSYWKPDPDASSEVDVSRRPVQSVVRCLDKRTGDVVFELAEVNRNDVYHSLACNIDEQWIDLHLPRRTVRFRYGPDDASSTEVPTVTEPLESNGELPPPAEP